MKLPKLRYTRQKQYTVPNPLFFIPFLKLVVETFCLSGRFWIARAIVSKQAIIITALYLTFHPAQLAFGETPAVGDPFPDLIFELPTITEQIQYLNLKGNLREFRLSQIGAEVLIVEIFSMYCPHCQREAPTLNALYRRIEADPGLAGKLKIIGIGAGNTAFEVDYFRKQYNIPFPLFPDGDFVIHKQLGEVRTPYFFGVHLRKGEPLQVLFSKLGGKADAAQILEEFIKRVSLEP
jgi:peroxiredoxin